MKGNSNIYFPRHYILLVHIVVWLVLIQFLFDLSGLYYSFQDLFVEQYREVDEAFLLIPFMIGLFYWNSELLIPQFLNRKSWWKYLLGMFASYFIIVFTSNFLFEVIENQDYVFRIDSEEFLDGSSMFYLLILLASSSWGASKIAFQNANQKKTAQQKQKEAELKYLNAQINPHFLYNTLNGIYAQAVEEAAEKTTEAILKLSEIMRYPIHQGLKNKVVLAEEISFIENYIALQKIRLGEDYPIVFKKEGNMEGLKIMPLCLIPLVENAFKYGISQRDKSVVSFHIKVNNQTLQFIAQNSLGRVDNKKSHHIGIDNLKSRLEIVYGEAYDLAFNRKKGRFEAKLKIHLK